METRERLRDHTRCQEQVAQGFTESAGTIVFLDGDDPAFFFDTRRQLARDALERKCSNTPYLELIEQLGDTAVVQTLQNGAHPDDDATSTRLEPAPRREGWGAVREFGGRVQPQIVGQRVLCHP